MSKKQKRKHWKKKQSSDNETAIYKLILDKPRRFGELAQELNISQTTLSNHLNNLQSTGAIVPVFDKEKKAFYYTIENKKKEEINARVKRSDTIKFIESITNPVYAPMKKDSWKIAVFSSASVTNREQVEKIAQNIAKSVRWLPKPPSSGEKMAVVMMVEG
jgi:predicted transcriptional regulator